jgi:hypothetical protein
MYEKYGPTSFVPGKKDIPPVAEQKALCISNWEGRALVTQLIYCDFRFARKQIELNRMEI